MELYRTEGKTDPITIAVRTWVMLCEIENYSENTSGYYWNAVSELPVLRYKHFVFTKHHILDFLQITYDLNIDLNSEDKAISSMIQEVCVSKLYPSLLYSMWMDDTTPKDFFVPKQNFVLGLLSAPVTKFQFMVEKNCVKEYLNRQHGVTNGDEARICWDNVHETLSTLLGEKAFFLSSYNKALHPRSADIIVYSFLAFEFKQDIKEAYESLSNYPNLLGLIRRVENCMRLKEKAGLHVIKDFGYVCLQVEEEMFYCGKVYESPLETVNFHWKRIGYKLGGEEPIEMHELSDSSYRRAYVTGAALVVFLFFYLKHRN